MYKIQSINIEVFDKQKKGILDMFVRKVNLFLSKEYDLNLNSIEYIEHLYNRLEIRVLQFCVMQKTTMPTIPKDDKVLMSTWKSLEYYLVQYLKHEMTDIKRVEYLKKLYFVRQSLLKGKSVTIGFNDNEYLTILLFEKKALETQITPIDLSINKKKLFNIEREIKLFYINQAIETRTMVKPIQNPNKIKITKAESDKIIDEKISRYEQIINLLANKRKLILEELYQEKSEIKSIDLNISAIKLDAEIESKKEFLKEYKNRKQIVP
jgi:hypothetical protein